VLAVLTNSWDGSTQIRPIVEGLNLRLPPVLKQEAVSGVYGLDTTQAVVADGRITETETDPVTGARIERKYPVSAGATLMSWRSDFPREDVARIGWTALPRIA
jgi:hypothetical protein